MSKIILLFLLFGSASAGIYSTNEEKEHLRLAGCTELDELLKLELAFLMTTVLKRFLAKEVQKSIRR